MRVEIEIRAHNRHMPRSVVAVAGEAGLPGTHVDHDRPEAYEPRYKRSGVCWIHGACMAYWCMIRSTFGRIAHDRRANIRHESDLPPSLLEGNAVNKSHQTRQYRKGAKKLTNVML